MPIPFVCPECGLKTDVDDQFSGQKGPCAGCGVIVEVPAVLGSRTKSTRKPKHRLVISKALLSVGALVLIFASLGLTYVISQPTITRFRNSAHQGQCENNLQRIAKALQDYHADKGSYPPAYTVDSKTGKPLHSWRVLILPYMGQNEKAIFNRVDLTTPWDSPANTWVQASLPSVYACPSDPGRDIGTTSYMVVNGKGLLFDGAATNSQSAIQDGAANTLMVVETLNSGVIWCQPVDVDLKMLAQGINSGVEGACGSTHPDNGMNVAMADGSIRFIPDFSTAEDLKGLATIDGGEFVSIPE